MSAAYILVDANGAPVPLPFHTTYEDLPVTVVGGEPPNGIRVGTVILAIEGVTNPITLPIDWFDLVWITEAEYMEKQS